MSKHLTPVEICEAVFGGPAGIAEVLGMHNKTPYLWRRSSKGRTAGDIPHSAQVRRLVAAARAAQVHLTTDHLTFGMTLDELGRLLPSRGQMAAE